MFSAFTQHHLPHLSRAVGPHRSEAPDGASRQPTAEQQRDTAWFGAGLSQELESSVAGAPPAILTAGL